MRLKIIKFMKNFVFNKTAFDDIEKYEADKKKNFKTQFIDQNM